MPTRAQVLAAVQGMQGARSTLAALVRELEFSETLPGGATLSVEFDMNGLSGFKVAARRGVFPVRMSELVESTADMARIAQVKAGLDAWQSGSGPWPGP